MRTERMENSSGRAETIATKVKIEWTVGRTNKSDKKNQINNLWDTY